MKRILNKLDNKTKSFLLSLLAVAFATLALSSYCFNVCVLVKVSILLVSWAVAIVLLILAGKVYNMGY